MDTKPVSEWDKLILDLGEANAKVAAFERSNAEMREAAQLAFNVLRGLRDDDLVPTSRIEDADEAIVALHLGRPPGQAAAKEK